MSARPDQINSEKFRVCRVPRSLTLCALPTERLAVPAVQLSAAGGPDAPWSCG